MLGYTFEFFLLIISSGTMWDVCLSEQSADTNKQTQFHTVVVFFQTLPSMSNKNSADKCYEKKNHMQDPLSLNFQLLQIWTTIA